MHSSERIGTFDGIQRDPLLLPDSLVVTPSKEIYQNTRSQSNKFVKRKKSDDEEFFLASNIPIEIDRRITDKTK
jgi:hypothetical protein